jgi:hypothetical protein
LLQDICSEICSVEQTGIAAVGGVLKASVSLKL